MVFIKGGVLHRFHDMGRSFGAMLQPPAPGDRMLCSGFHPFTRVVDALELQQPTLGCSSAEAFEGEMAHAQFHAGEERRRASWCS